MLVELRRKFPDREWSAVRNGFGWSWRSSRGDLVRKCAAMDPRYDGDDDNYRTEVWMYPADGTAPINVDNVLDTQRLVLNG